MPLSAKTRIEIYLPDLPNQVYQDLLRIFSEEFSNAFGGCIIVRGLDGNYLSQFGKIISDRVNLLYTDAPFNLQENFSAVSDYADELRKAAFEGLEEEAILVVAWQIYHSI